MCSCPLATYASKNFAQKKRLLFTLASYFIGLAMILMGADFSIIRFIPEKFGLYCVFISMCMIGFATVFIYIPIVPEILSLVNYTYPNNSKEINADITSNLYNSIYSLACFIGPILGILKNIFN